MIVFRRRQSEKPLQIDLTRRGGQQISAANDLRNASLRIVGHNGQLIGIDAVGAAYDKIAAFARQIFAVFPLKPVVKGDLLVRHDQPPCRSARFRGAFFLRQIPAGARIDHIAVRSMGRGGRVQLAA